MSGFCWGIQECSYHGDMSNSDTWCIRNSECIMIISGVISYNDVEQNYQWVIVTQKNIKREIIKSDMTVENVES